MAVPQTQTSKNPGGGKPVSVTAAGKPSKRGKGVEVNLSGETMELGDEFVESFSAPRSKYAAEFQSLVNATNAAKEKASAANEDPEVAGLKIIKVYTDPKAVINLKAHALEKGVVLEFSKRKDGKYMIRVAKDQTPPPKRTRKPKVEAPVAEAPVSETVSAE